MTTLEVKNDLLKLVAETDDLAVLKHVQAFFQSLLKNKDWWDELSETEKKMIQTGRRQLANGEGIPYEQVKAKVKEMLSKN